ncbi:MAG: DUF4338 domain-containing protein [Gammaproteobacteria bacterium]|nr:DUF4338 domain-containing protein [Gammaproteobacteria bacterium]MYG68035.1 DUF4338 domain-containing protein [Gammaproteobacteria bacterium]
MGKNSTVIPAFSKDSKLKRRIRNHLRALGFQKNKNGNLIPPASTKDSIRKVHAVHRADVLKRNADFVACQLPKLKHYFASGYEIDPGRIQPKLELIRSGTWQSELFRLATLSWSIPVSAGFGRRMRYLVWDQHNEKIIGLIALGDPVFNLKARDEYIGWDSEARRQRMVYILDAYVLGAVPPYNSLLCGKLVACLVRTDQVRRDFQSKYGQTIGIISQEAKRAKLVMVTTSSALGRSSVYNRLKINGEEYFRSIGFTGGWGHFHVPDDLFWDLREYLRGIGHKYVNSHAFGDGPNWRLRTIRAALDELGFRGDLLRHGIQREVFTCNLATNATKILLGEQKRPIFSTIKSVDEVSELVKERWIVPRAGRKPDYVGWDVVNFENLIKAGISAQIRGLESKYC